MRQECVRLGQLHVGEAGEGGAHHVHEAHEVDLLQLKEDIAFEVAP